MPAYTHTPHHLPLNSYVVVANRVEKALLLFVCVPCDSSSLNHLLSIESNLLITQ
nr:MAG TPA: hypothetical protein [Caudoviricetes sp.]DAW89808.1 MAG TPA: hypothetical protein [Caudoviricetes sp.]